MIGDIDDAHGPTQTYVPRLVVPQRRSAAIHPRGTLGAIEGSAQSHWLQFRRSAWYSVYRIAQIAGVTTGAYHGYKRNDSVGWAVGWGVLGGMFPFVTIPVSLAQGFGKRKASKNRRRRR